MEGGLPPFRKLALGVQLLRQQVQNALALLKPDGSDLQRKLWQTTRGSQCMPLSHPRVHPGLHGLHTRFEVALFKVQLFDAFCLGLASGFVLRTIEPGVGQVVGIHDVPFKGQSPIVQCLWGRFDALPCVVAHAPGLLNLLQGDRLKIPHKLLQFQLQPRDLLRFGIERVALRQGLDGIVSVLIDQTLHD